MPIITVEDVECPCCGEVFDLDDVDTDKPEEIEPTCPECGAELLGTYDPTTGSVELEEAESDDEPVIIDVETEESDVEEDEVNEGQDEG